ncbi:MAG TPA: SDR family oxidoreductase [Acidimicrobiales bacterium]|nr:SDR family oxidoreductase [Acidimicrobiales bacterium]
MRIFVTGASGWIGSALVPQLLEAGHEVAGLARSDQSARKLESAGALVVRGDLDHPDGLARAAADSDGVIHLAFQHEIAFGAGDFATAATADRRAVEAMGTALAGSDRPLVLASGTAGLQVGVTATENDGLVPGALIRGTPLGFRQATALYVLSLRGIGVRSSVLRLPPTVHGDGDAGFIATFVAVARERGVSAYVGDGANRWPAVHVSDAAHLARLAAESAPAGSVLHAVADEGVAFRDIAGVIARHAGVADKSITPEEALGHFGPLGVFAALDMAASSAVTRELMGWDPTGPSLLEDLELGHYFDERAPASYHHTH